MHEVKLVDLMVHEKRDANEQLGQAVDGNFLDFDFVSQKES